MNSAKLNSRKREIIGVVALLMVLQMLLISVNARIATGAATELNITTEARELASFGETLLPYIEQENVLSKKSRLTAAEVTALRSKGDALKQRIPAVQQNLRSFIAKLKAANRWDTLDAKLISLISDSGLRSSVQQEGGARKIIEDLANNIGTLAPELDADVQRLSRKIQAQSSFGEGELRDRAARAAYQPSPIVAKSLKCRAAIAVLTVKMFVGNRDATTAEVKHIFETCNPGSTLPVN